MKKFFLFGFALVGLIFVVFLSGCIDPILDPPPSFDGSCSEDSDCVCGFHEFGECFIGNKGEIMSSNNSCEYFCDAFESVKCQKNKCVGVKLSDEKFCNSDSDCACGVHTETRECFFGNKFFVDTETQCADYCTGISGEMRIKCVENTCSGVWP